jgi:hypothetical protein
MLARCSETRKTFFLTAIFSNYGSLFGSFLAVISKNKSSIYAAYSVIILGV